MSMFIMSMRFENRTFQVPHVKLLSSLDILQNDQLQTPSIYLFSFFFFFFKKKKLHLSLWDLLYVSNGSIHNLLIFLIISHQF